MIARKCDACGKLYELYNMKDSTTRINGIMTLNIDIDGAYNYHGPYDLCPECSKKIIDMLKDTLNKEKLRQ